jgi:LmbE family N-acetylglucosaminyl deacetylase
MVTMSITEDASEAIKATVLGAAGDDVRAPQIDGRALVRILARSRHNRPPDCAARSRRELRRDHRRCEGLTKRALGRLQDADALGLQSPRRRAHEVGTSSIRRGVQINRRTIHTSERSRATFGRRQTVSLSKQTGLCRRGLRG